MCCKPARPRKGRPTSLIRAIRDRDGASGGTLTYGNTDEIIQWVSCNWGFDTDAARSSSRRKQLGRILKNFIMLNRMVLIKCLPRPQSGKQLDPAEEGLAWQTAVDDRYRSDQIRQEAPGSAGSRTRLWADGGARGSPDSWPPSPSRRPDTAPAEH